MSDKPIIEGYGQTIQRMNALQEENARLKQELAELKNEINNTDADWRTAYYEERKENTRLKEQVEEQRGYAEHARKDRSKYGALADKFEAELAVVTSAAKASAKLLMQAEEEIEKLVEKVKD